MTTTLKHIAEASKVSIQTASAALKGGSGVSAANRERIRTIAEQLNYRPNTSARAVRTGRFGSITLLAPMHQDFGHLPWQLLAGMEEALAEHEYQLSMARLPDDQLTDAGYIPRVLRERMADGMLINYHHHIPAGMVEMIREHGLPSIWLNSRQVADCVYPDEYRAGIEAVHWLVGRGHKRIVYLDFVHGLDELALAHYSAPERLAGYRYAMTEAGLEPRVVYGEHHKIAHTERLDRARALLTGPDRATAVIAYSATSAGPIVVAGEMLGLKHAEDYELLTFDDMPVRMAGLHELTTLPVPHRAMGRAAVDMLMRKIERPHEPVEPRSIPYTVRPGKDTHVESPFTSSVEGPEGEEGGGAR